MNYVEPSILLSWNIPKTVLGQNCINKEISIVGSNPILKFPTNLRGLTKSWHDLKM